MQLENYNMKNEIINDVNGENEIKMMYEIKPVLYRTNDLIKWDFPKELQDKIRNESLNENSNDLNDSLNNNLNILSNYKVCLKDDIINEINQNMEKRIQFCPYKSCICINIKNPNCNSPDCKYKFSKIDRLNNDILESRFKDGLEILDIPSTLLCTIEKRKKDKNKNKNKKNMNNRRNKNQNEQIIINLTNNRQLPQNNTNNVQVPQIQFRPFIPVPIMNGQLNVQINGQINGQLNQNYPIPIPNPMFRYPIPIQGFVNPMFGFINPNSINQGNVQLNGQNGQLNNQNVQNQPIPNNIPNQNIPTHIQNHINQQLERGQNVNRKINDIESDNLNETDLNKPNDSDNNNNN